MTRSVAQAEGTIWTTLFGWGGWTPPIMPSELNVIDEWDGPWREPVTGRKVDLDRTAALADVDMPITINAGQKPYQGTSYGYPINVADRRRNVQVTNLARDRAVSTLPLPAVVRIEGDPAGAFDRHLRLVDPVGMVCWEAIQAYVIGGGVNVGYAGAGDGMTRWDMSQRWTVDSPGRGVVAANVPHTPMLTRFDEIAGGIRHCLPIVLPDYSSDPAVGWARHRDGTLARHPLRAGDILRMSCVEWIRQCNRWPVGTMERALADAAFTHGLFVIDKSGGSGSASISLTQDRRFATLRDMGMRLTHFEVLAA